MDSRKSIMHPRVEELGGISPVSSSPLRRRSIAAQKVAPTSLVENDDEAERRNRRLENQQPQAGSSGDRRRSLGLGFLAEMSNPQIAEKVQHCIQLNAENKINTKNAFSLQMIDFMTYMIKKRDANMDNLQVASTSLDVSTKIYGLRVDGIHTDIVKMSGSLDKQDKQDARRDDDDGEGDAGGPSDVDGQTRERARKKRNCKKKIIVSPESLNAPTETVNLTSTMMGAGDAQTTDTLYLATIPYHANRGTYLQLQNEYLLDSADPKAECNNSTVTFPMINNIDDAEMCSSLANFDLVGWSVDDEKEETTQDETTDVDNGFHFDLDASLPAEQEPSNAGMNYFDMDDDERVDGCDRVPQPAANIVDFCGVISATAKPQNLEYSYFDNNMNVQWAGPSYWKFRNPARNIAGSRIIGRCDQEPIRRKKELNIDYDDDTIAVATAKFAPSKGNLSKLQPKTAKTVWSEEKITLPEDVHYNVSQTRKFYLRNEVIVDFSSNDDANATQVSDDVGNYDYNNEHDTTDYCPNLPCDEQPETGADGVLPNVRSDFDEHVETCTQAFTGDNLVELPKMTNDIVLQYSLRAKRIDMRQLKKCLWKSLTNFGSVDKENTNVDNDDPEKVNGIIKFADVYRQLPKTLSKRNVEALNLPIAFISLLHLANEKTLEIVACDDHSDLSIRQE